MKWRLLILLVLLAATLAGNSVLTCSYDGGAFGSSGCLSLSTFHVTDSLDWAAAYGSADTAVNPNEVYNPVANGPWSAVTAGGLAVGATLAYNYSGIQTTLARVDNFQMVYDGGWQFAPFDGYSTWALYSGMFDAASVPGAPAPGDHLLYTNHGEGPLELTFGSDISGALFRISTPTSGDVTATIAAYSVANPTALDTPIMTYSIIATNAAGSCATLIGAPPAPCNLAPYIGFDGLLGVRSLVVSTTDSAGLLIDTLFVDGSEQAVPEPGTWRLFGGTLILLLMMKDRALFRRRS